MATKIPVCVCFLLLTDWPKVNLEKHEIFGSFVGKELLDWLRWKQFVGDSSRFLRLGSVGAGEILKHTHQVVISWSAGIHVLQAEIESLLDGEI